LQASTIFRRSLSLVVRLQDPPSYDRYTQDYIDCRRVGFSGQQRLCAAFDGDRNDLPVVFGFAFDRFRNPFGWADSFESWPDLSIWISPVFCHFLDYYSFDVWKTCSLTQRWSQRWKGKGDK
jgi:hypothetical protein